MSLSPEDLQRHCQTILKDSRINKKIVVLCEGRRLALSGRPSPSSYKNQEYRPDASFYNDCVPDWWTQAQIPRPRFFTCGDRHDVISTYFALQAKDEKECVDSNLDKNKLFAVIDLDLHADKFPDDYLVKDTEALFYELYQQGHSNQQALLKHAIFITGLIHKEAYFLIPDLQPVFESFPMQVHYKDQPINLPEIYKEMAFNLKDDANIKNNFARAIERIRHCPLNFDGFEALQQSLLESMDSATNSPQQKLVYGLLTVHRVKDYWKNIKPSQESGFQLEQFKEQLTSAIAQFYAKQERDSSHHIPSFFTALSGRA